MSARPNRALWRAAHSLTHPAIVAAVIGLLLNDHWLRYAHPSWLTGKLGDFTWLIFAPLIAAIFFALVIPRRIENHTRIVGWLSFGSVGLWFAAAKTIPAVHAATAAAWSALVGWPGSLRLDPTDLLALPGLLIGAWMWSRAEDSPLNLRPLAYVIAALGLVGTLANTPPIYPPLGVTCLSQEDHRLITVGALNTWQEPSTAADNEEQQSLHDGWDRYTSRDGGFSWQYEFVRDGNVEDYPECSPSTLLIDPQNPDIQYRWEPGESIERSSDEGQSWVREFDLYPLRQDVRTYYNHGRDDYEPGPFSGIVDTATGNVVLAMGLDGVLVRTPDSQWHWVRVYEYGLVELQSALGIFGVLFYDVLLGAVLALLVASSSALYIRWVPMGLLRRAAALLPWIGWIGFAFIVGLQHYDITNPATGLSMRVDPGLSCGLLYFAIVPLCVGTLWDISRNFRRYEIHIYPCGLGVALLYLFPLILWSQGTIPRYTTAIAFSLILTLAGLFAAYKYLTRVLPVLPGRDPITEDSAAGDSDEVDGG